MRNLVTESDQRISTLAAKWKFGDLLSEIAEKIGDKDVPTLLSAYSVALGRTIRRFPRHFDEVYYLKANQDVLTAVLAGRSLSGLHHFLMWGAKEGRPPNESWAKSMKGRGSPPPKALHRKSYFERHPSVKEFLSDFPIMSVQEFAEVFGRQLRHFDESEEGKWAVEDLHLPSKERLKSRIKRISEGFDALHYAKTYLQGKSTGKELDHYIKSGVLDQLNPTPEFDEKFYRAMYPDVEEAIRTGALLCGYEHFILAGKREGRIPKFSSQKCLEAFYPGITNPSGLRNIEILEAKLNVCDYSIVRGSCRPRIWIMLPFLNPDLMFGGFASIYEFIERCLAQHLRIGLFLREAPASQIDYYLYRSPKESRLRSVIRSLKIYSPHSNARFEFTDSDLFLSYSVWEGIWAQTFSAHTRWKLPIYWIQEYESIFHKNDSFHFISSSAYHRPHVGVFNSKLLLEHFREQKIGIYARPASTRAIHFEHLLWNAPVKKVAKPRRKTFFIYARPEDHAGRNLFEIAVLALRSAIRLNYFQGPWRFVGLGSLDGPYKVSLGRGAHLEIFPRMEPAEYADFIRGVDVGMSLMYAPHPSLLPFELALSGAVVITNEYGMRDRQYFRKRDPRIVSFRPTLEDCVAAIETAVKRARASPEIGKSLKGKYPESQGATWSEIFDAKFFRVLERKIGRGFSWKIFQEGPEPSAGKSASKT